MPRNRKKKEYYAVYKGRVDKPTIFSSWGDAHPRITGCSFDIKVCETLEEARAHMANMGETKPKEVIKNGAGETTPLGGNGFYAVANGVNPGIFPFYYGKKGAQKEVDGETSACHKKFRTMAQAEAFIEDWKKTYAEIWYKLIMEALNKGLRPSHISAFRADGMKLIIDQFLQMPHGSTEIDEITERTRAQLSLEDHSSRK